jgi:hypothetical protein
MRLYVIIFSRTTYYVLTARRACPHLRETLTRPIDEGAYLYGMDLRTVRLGAPLGVLLGALGAFLHYVHVLNACMLTLPHFNIMFVLYSSLCGTSEYHGYHPIIFPLCFMKDASGKGFVNMSAI